MKLRYFTLLASSLAILTSGCFGNKDGDSVTPKPVTPKDYLTELLVSLEKTSPDSPQLNNMKKLLNDISATSWKNAPIAMYSVPPFGQRQYPPFGPLPDSLPTREIEIVLPPGETTSASFVLYSFKDLANVEISGTPLASKRETLTESVLDLRIVKYRYREQASWESSFAGNETRRLDGELLLYDENMLKVDTNEKENYIRVDYPHGSKYVWVSYPTEADPGNFDPRKEPVNDAPVLQPFILKEAQAKQFWITLSVPLKTKPGIYTADMTFTANKTDILGTVTLRVKVLPFTLPPPSVYRDTGKQFVLVAPFTSLHSHIFNDNDLKTACGLMNKELADITSHQITHYPYGSFTHIKTPKDIRKAEEKLISKTSLSPMMTMDPEAVTGIRLYDKICKTTVRDSHALQKTILYTLSPGPLDTPEFIRRKAGLLPYKCDFDGVNLIPAQMDGDSNQWHSFFFAPMKYKINNGEIPTLRWEAFREGVNDVRYATKLFMLSEKLLNDKDAGNISRANVVNALKSIVEFNEYHDDPDALRTELIRLIMEFEKQLKGN